MKDKRVRNKEEIKIQTSYFAKYKMINGISICRFTPDWFTGGEYKKLAPSKKLLLSFKNNEIDEDEFEVEYRKQLSKLNAKDVAKDLNGKTVLCVDKAGEFCHRHIFADWLNEELGIEVNEFTDKKYKNLVIGIDESYQETAISIMVDNKKLLKYYAVKFEGMKTKSEKRLYIRKMINWLLTKSLKIANNVKIIVERIRTFSKGGGQNKFSLSTDYIKSTAAFISNVVDVAYLHGVPVYSVDTRSWKAQVLGSSKSSGNNNNSSRNKNKNTAIAYVKQKYDVDVKYKTKTGLVKYDDNIADSICIAEYGFIPVKNQTLKLES